MRELESRLQDQVVAVAGGATGIGAECARRLVAEGAHVAIGDLHVRAAEVLVDELTAAGGDAEPFEYDQGDEESIRQFLTGVCERFGRVNGVLVNAAEVRSSILGEDVGVDSMSPAVWDQTLRVNLIGSALIVRESLPLLLVNGGGAIVCMSSDNAVIGSPNRPAYGSSKAGINALVRHVAGTWGKQGVRCNAISPGFIRTETAMSNMGEEWIQHVIDRTPSTRAGEPSDVAAATAFLLSSDAEYVNGQVWSINGGMTFRG